MIAPTFLYALGTRVHWRLESMAAYRIIARRWWDHASGPSVVDYLVARDGDTPGTGYWAREAELMVVPVTEAPV